jgi:TPR repeat protein
MKIIETSVLVLALFFQIPLAYCADGDSASNEEIIRILKKAQTAADNGDKESQRAIGNAYQMGIGNYPKDAQKAFSWFLKAAHQGDIDSQVAVGTAYRDGQGVKKDRKEAIKWLEMATSSGDMQGRFELAMLHMDKRRPEQEKKVGLALLQENVQKQHPQSLWLMGELYMDGLLVEKSESRAVEHWLKAVQGGSNAGAFSLGKYYLKDAVKRDEGLRLIRLSASKKYKPAEDFLKANP